MEDEEEKSDETEDLVDIRNPFRHLDKEEKDAYLQFIKLLTRAKHPSKRKQQVGSSKKR